MATGPVVPTTRIARSTSGRIDEAPASPRGGSPVDGATASQPLRGSDLPSADRQLVDFPDGHGEPIRLLWRWEIPMRQEREEEILVAAGGAAAAPHQKVAPEEVAPEARWKPHQEVVELLAELLVEHLGSRGADGTP